MKMRLVGYIKEQRKNYFAKPVYSDNGIEYFYHETDELYLIKNFVKIQTDIMTLKKIYLSKNIEVGGKAAIVFVGPKGYLKYDIGQNAIDEVINYINDNPTSIDSFNELLNQALNLKKIIFSKRIKNNKSKKNIVKKEFILTFDFPSPLTNENKEPKTIALLDDDSDAKIQSKIIKLQAAEKNFETTLRQRSEARRNKLKSYNYQFTHGRKTK